MILFFRSYFKMIHAINEKVDNCAYISIVIFTVNFSVLFLSANEKSHAMQMFLRLHSENEVVLFAIENFF